jgi:hypothetical protein
MDQWGADLRNGILTYNTLDNTTPYWVDLIADSSWDEHRTNIGGDFGFNANICVHVYGSDSDARLDLALYEECQRIRDSK